MKFSVAAVFVLLTIGGCRMVTPPSSETRDTNQASVEAASDETPSFMRGDKQYQQLAREELAKLEESQKKTMRDATGKMIAEQRQAFTANQAAFLSELVEMSRTIYYKERYEKFVASLTAKEPKTADRAIVEYAIRYAIMREIIQPNPALVEDVFKRAFDRANGGAPVPLQQFIKPSHVLMASVAVAVLGRLFLVLAENDTSSVRAEVGSYLLVGGIVSSVGSLSAVLYELIGLPVDQLRDDERRELELRKVKTCAEMGGYWEDGRCRPTEAALARCRSRGGYWKDGACVK